MFEPAEGLGESPSARRLDADTLETRFAALRPKLLRICASLIGDGEAEDAVQDAYLLASRRLHQLHDERLFEAWVKRIAVNRCYDHHRRRRPLASPAPLEHMAGSRTERDVALRELVEELPPRQRTVLVLHYGHGYGLEEIATILSLSHTNVRTIIARTRRRLQQALLEAER